MQTSTIETNADVARSTRERLRGAGVRCVNVTGGAGCGKTSLLRETARQLGARHRVGVITADPYARPSAEPLTGPVVPVDAGSATRLTPHHVRAALDGLNLAGLDLVLIENVSSFAGPGDLDLGECARVSVFSVAAGAHKPGKYPDAARRADAVVLNKVDLLTIAPFDLPTFRESVRSLNPAAPLFELSTRTGDGLDRWVDWLLRRPGTPARGTRRGGPAQPIISRPHGH
jgi:hydrogenase nickel incorporation protein HypB